MRRSNSRKTGEPEFTDKGTNLEDASKIFMPRALRFGHCAQMKSQRGHYPKESALATMNNGSANDRDSDDKRATKAQKDDGMPKMMVIAKSDASVDTAVTRAASRHT